QCATPDKRYRLNRADLRLAQIHRSASMLATIRVAPSNSSSRDGRCLVWHGGRISAPDSWCATRERPPVHTGGFLIDLPKVAGVNCGKSVIRGRLMGRSCQTMRPTSGGTHVG